MIFVYNAIAQHPGAALFLLAFAATFGILAFCFPATTLGVMGGVSLLIGAGLAFTAFATIKAPSEGGALFGAFMGIYALSTGVGIAASGLALLAAGGGIASIRRRQI